MQLFLGSSYNLAHLVDGRGCQASIAQILQAGAVRRRELKGRQP
jgi:hypothetical protein